MAASRRAVGVRAAPGARRPWTRGAGCPGIRALHRGWSRPHRGHLCGTSRRSGDASVGCREASAGFGRLRVERRVSQSAVELIWLDAVELALWILWILWTWWSRWLRWSAWRACSGCGFGRGRFGGLSEFSSGGVGEFVSDAGDAGDSRTSWSGSGGSGSGVSGQGEVQSVHLVVVEITQ